jgi:hypothetical protein
MADAGAFEFDCAELWVWLMRAPSSLALPNSGVGMAGGFEFDCAELWVWGMAGGFGFDCVGLWVWGMRPPADGGRRGITG